MKHLLALTTLVAAANAHSSDEIENIKASQAGYTAPMAKQSSSACKTKPLDPNQLIQRVSKKTSAYILLFNEIRIFEKFGSNIKLILIPFLLKYDLNMSNPEHVTALADAINGNLNLGTYTQLIPESNDAGRVGALVIDGLSGDIDFPYGDIKPLYTVGEINVCEENHGDVVSY